MTFSFTVTEERRKTIPEALHVDGSARPQTGDAETLYLTRRTLGVPASGS